MIFEIVEKTSSTNQKIETLKSCNEKEKEFLRITYDPYVLSNINKIDITSVGKRTFEESVDEYFGLFNRLSMREITGNVARETVTTFMNSVNEDAQTWFKKSLKKDLKIGINVSSLNSAFGDFIKEFSVQLANQYKKEKVYKNKTWFASPKLDGLRCIYVYNRKDEYPIHINRGLFTRNGHKICGFTNIESECEKICIEKNLNFLDGELYSHVIPFETIQGAVMRDVNIDSKQKEQIFYNVFACEQNVPHFTTRQMVEILNSIIAPFINVVQQIEIENVYSVIKALHDKFVEDGYEGIMLRDSEIYYDFKRSNLLLKLKDFFEDDFEIIGVEFGGEGTKIESTIGRILVKKNGIESWVGSGFTDLKRANFLELHQNGELVGKMVEVKFQGITDKNSLRFPVVKKIKLDR